MWILQWLPFWIFYAILFVGIIGFATTYLLRFIPIPAVYMYKTPIQLVSILFIVIGVYMHEVKDIDRHKLGIFVRDLLLNVEQDELPSERTQTFM